MKTIAIDIRLLGKKRTGDETVFFHLTKALIASDRENEYRLLIDLRDPKRLAVIRARLGAVGRENVKLITLLGKNRFVWNLVTLPWYLFHTRIDVYHTQYILPFFLPRRTQVVTHIHDVSFRAYPEFIDLRDRFFLKLLIPGSLRRAARIIAPSEFTKEEIGKYYGISQDKVVVIPNAPADIFFVQEKEKTADFVRKRYQLPEKFLLYIGTLQPRKNIPELLEAFSQLRKRLPEVKLVLGGSLTAHNVDRALIPTLKRLDLVEHVIFPGYISEEDLPAVMRLTTVFVFPSRYEGFGIPILEAMSQGIPVVASDIPSLRESGGTAYVAVVPDDIAALSEKLYTLCITEEARQHYRELGFERVKLFSWQQSAERLLALYQSL